MNSMTERTKRQAATWSARLVWLQLALGGGVRAAPTDEDGTWPAFLVHAGALLASLGGLLVAAWLRRHL